MFDLVSLLSLKGFFTILLTLFLGLLTMILVNWLKALNYYKGRNIPGPSPVPVFGNFHKIASTGVLQMDMEWRKQYGKVIGTFEGPTPVILIHDVNFIKNVLIKDFHQFANRRVLEAALFKPLDKFMTVLKDDEWKNVRSVVTSAFTSGKLKRMTKCIDTCAQNYMAYLEDLVDKKDGIMDTKAFSQYTLDVICACCFGIDSDTIRNPDSEFVTYLKKVTSTTLKDPRLMLAAFAPSLAKFLIRAKIMSLVSPDGLDFLERVMNEVIDMRVSKKEKRDDFIQLVLEYQNEEQDPENFTLKTMKQEDKVSESVKPKRKLTNSEILSQSILFVLAGYETTAMTLSYLAYNLATHRESQEKLLREIDEIVDKHDSKINYESVSEMNYLDMVIDETLRMYPPAPRIDRVAGTDYEYENIKIKKGEVFCVPIYAIHHDPEIFPDPEEFKPERFDESNKKQQKDGVSFLSFGAGPRNCVGMRFAYLEIKLLVANILSKYKFEKCEQTVDKIVLDKSGTRTNSEKPIFVKVSLR